MPVHSIAALILWQGAELSGRDLHLLMIFAGIIAGALVVSAGGMVLTSIFAAKLLHRVHCIAKEAQLRTGPILDKTNALLLDLSPKIHAVTTNVEQISYSVRAKVDELGETVSQLNQTVQEIHGRTRVQVAHVDGIVTGVLNTAEEVTHTVQEGIKGPLRQVAGILAGVKAGLEKLVQMSPFGRD